MGKTKNLKGKRFGRLICKRIVGREEKSKCVLWECKCDCGNTTIVRSDSLRNGNTRSCGCLQREIAAE